MKINEIIKYYRKKESLTQEQIASYLNISTPAVNKWERWVSYPDITLLPSLARLLKIDINTLLGFNDNLTDSKIESLVNNLIYISRNLGYQEAFKNGCDLIKQFPTCDKLIYEISTALRIELLISNIKQKDKFEKKYIEWLQLVASNNKEKVSSMAKLDLSSIYCRKKEYEKAQEILDTISDIEVDKTFQQAILFKSSGRIEKAYETCEEILLKNADETLRVLIYILVILC